MACGLPVVATAGGPTDEFLPEDAGWRLAARRAYFAENRIDTLQTCGRPWLLEPDRADLVRLLREADAADDDELQARGEAGRAAAQSLSWDRVAALYEERIVALAARRPVSAGVAEPFPLEEQVDLRVLAAPAWRGEDRLGDLLAEWVAATTRQTSACLYLLFDPTVDGDPESLEAWILGAAEAAGADLETGADINVLMEPAQAARDPRLHAAVNAFVPLHAANSGHTRLAVEAGNAVVQLGGGAIGALVAGSAEAIAADAIAP
jgi:hypothetical protein